MCKVEVFSGSKAKLQKKKTFTPSLSLHAIYNVKLLPHTFSLHFHSGKTYFSHFSYKEHVY